MCKVYDKICDKMCNKISYPKHNVRASLQTQPTQTLYNQCHPVCKHGVNLSSVDNKVVLNEFHLQKSIYAR